MKVRRSWLILMLCGLLCTALVATSGCTPSAPSDDKTSTGAEQQPATADSGTSTAATGSDAAESNATTPEIYSLLPNLALSGVVNPNMPDRADINKAWPKTPKDPKKIRIGWTEINQASDWFVAVKTGAEKRAKELGFDMSFLVADDDPNKQTQQVDTFISQDVDIIVVDPVNSSAPVADINRAVEAGIPVLCIGTVPDDCAALTTVTANPFMNGYECGKYVAEQFKDVDNIIATAILGVMGSSTSESRICGMIAGILEGRNAQKGSPYGTKEDAWLAGYNMFETLKTSGKASDETAGFHINGSGVGEWTVEGGLAAAEDLITANSDMNLILAENDFMAAGALTALKTAGMVDKVKIAAAADGTRVGLEMIKDGTMLTTGPNSGDVQGEWAIDFIDSIFNQGKDPSNLALGSYFAAYAMTKDNVDSLYDPNITFFKTGAFEFPKSIPEIKAEAGA